MKQKKVTSRQIKNALLIVLSGLLIISFVWCFNLASNKNKLDKELSLLKTEYSPMYEYFSSLSIEEFNNRVDSGEELLVYIGRPTCPDCTAFEPLFEELIEEYELQNKLYYVNVKWLRAGDGDSEKGVAEMTEQREKYGFNQVPALIRFVDGEIATLAEWEQSGEGKGLSKNEVIDWLEEVGLV